MKCTTYLILTSSMSQIVKCVLAASCLEVFIRLCLLIHNDCLTYNFQLARHHLVSASGVEAMVMTQRAYVIQIKICAEYRDMLPRPRLVCQEPGLRPIGRSPGVPDKSSRGLGSMSRYSAQILICFIAYIFLIFFHSSVGLVGNFAGLPVCTVPSAIVHCNQNEAGHQTIKTPSMPCWGAAGPSKQSLAFKSQSGENDR